MTASDEPPTVLAVDDDLEILEVIQAYLEGYADLRTADSGNAALAAVDGGVDVVLLDRILPDMHGDDILDDLRRRDLDCGVIMVSAAPPDVDIATLHYNEYLVKPIDQGDLRRAIDRVAALSDRAIQVQEYFALADKIHALEGDRAADGRRRDADVRDLRARMARLEDRIEPDLTPIEAEIARELAEKWPQDPPTVAPST